MADHPAKRDPGRIMSVISAGVALLCLLVVLVARYWRPDWKAPVGAVMLPLWVLLPPVWFWVEWVFLSKGQDQERLKHTHDLARNIWLALVVVLSVILEVDWPL